ncbi:hypothetical protein ColTof4_10157 [Colletotrichum tofieldiae]|nr:hypothetical protein ColTof3_06182 [Colletotrichum tofieldiae]GKT77734.1 hypothetical protein ColTof4_10157 [Colletotrichum tofieldiae]
MSDQPVQDPWPLPKNRSSPLDPGGKKMRGADGKGVLESPNAVEDVFVGFPGSVLSEMGPK